MIEISSDTFSQSCNQDSFDELQMEFWRLWQEHRDYLYRCCCKWIGGNSIDAEDTLSRATIKAWEKFQKAAGSIRNFKAWISQLTYHLCVDFHRECQRRATGVEDLDAIASEAQLDSQTETPVLAA